MPPDGDLPTININALRGHVLGVSLDNSVTPGVDDWFITSGSTSNRNALTTSEKIITKVLNSLESTTNVALDAVNGFGARFSGVVGNEGQSEKLAFEKLGTNLINAVVNLQELSTDLVGLPEWNTNDYTLTFKTGAGDEVVVNLPLESLAMGLDYDHLTQEIILVKYDGSEIRVNIGDLVALYEGYASTSVTTEILSENKIKATINLASIGTEHLKPDVLELLGGATVSPQANNMLSQLPDGLFVPKVSEVAVSSQPDNLIEKKPDGLYVPEISADADNFVGIIITDPASEQDKQIFPMGTVKPAAYLAGQFYAVLFTNGHTASTLRLAFDTLPLKNVVYNNDYTIPTDLIPKGSMHLFAYTGSNFVYVGKNFEQLAEGVFTTAMLPNFKTYGELTLSNLNPVGANEKLMLNSMIIDEEGKLAKVKGIGSTTATVYTIKDSDENETSVDHDSVRYNISRHLESVKFVDNNTGLAVGKITNEPADLALSELAITTATASQRIVSIRKPDDSVSWQLRVDKGQVTNLNIDENDDLLNRGQIVNLMHEVMGSALRTPEYIPLESGLPVITGLTPDGTYYIIGDMDITAPGHEGRAWVNLAISTTNYQMIADKGVDADGDWIILNANNDFTFNTDKIITDISTVAIQTDTGKPVSIDALLQIDGKATNAFQGLIPDELSFPASPLEGYWVMIDNCNITSPTNSGIAVFSGGFWIVFPFEAGTGNITVIPEPSDDGELYLRQKQSGIDGQWVRFEKLDGKARPLILKTKNSELDFNYIPADGELIFLEDISNLTVGNGITNIAMLPLIHQTQTSTTLDERLELIANKGAIQGYAPLDDNRKIPALFLPETITESITETEIDLKISNLRNELQANIISEATDRIHDDNQNATNLSNHIANTSVHVTSIEKTIWDSKVDQTDLAPFNSHILQNDIHVTLDEKLKWNGRVSAYLVGSISEMQALDQELLKLGDICYVRQSPGSYSEYVWYDIDGWHEHAKEPTLVNLEWAGINNKPTAATADIDSAVTLKHSHANILSLNKINELNGQLTYNGIPVGATIAFLATDAFLPTVGKEDLLYIVYRDSRSFNFPTISVWRNTQYEILGGGNGGSAVSPTGDAVLLQRELFGVVSGSDFIINVHENQQFAFYPMEVLRLIEGPKNQIRLYTNFTNPDIFNFNRQLIKIQSGLFVGPYEITMDFDQAAAGRYYHSKTINTFDYHSVDEIY